MGAGESALHLSLGTKRPWDYGNGNGLSRLPVPDHLWRESAAIFLKIKPYRKRRKIPFCLPEFLPIPPSFWKEEAESGLRFVLSFGRGSPCPHF